MSVWQLSGSEGALVSVSLTVSPRDLEGVLEELSTLDFPVNPQIYHGARVVYLYPNGREENEPATIVEFPAYEARLPEIRQALPGYALRCHPPLGLGQSSDKIEGACRNSSTATSFGTRSKAS
jgi:hypothetical protein